MICPSTPVRSRLSKEARREQLLDAAAVLLAEKGPGSITMEGLALAAGVSKALPYNHFDNASAVEAALYDREVTRLGTAVAVAVEPLPNGPDRLAAAIRTYFTFVAENGAVLSALVASPSVVEGADPELGRDFVGTLLTDSFPIDPAAASIHGALVLGVLGAATELWARGAAPRETLENEVIDFVIGAVSEARTVR